MVASQAYDKFILKSERNSTNDNVSTDPQRFVELYNEAQIRFTEHFYNRKADDDLRYIQSLLVLDKRLAQFKKSRENYSFELPGNYFDFSSAYALGSRGDCENQKLTLIREVDDFNRPLYMTDEFVKPDFNYRETIYNIGGGNINVFYDKFNIDAVIISYYRYPRPLRLQNPDNPESPLDDSFQLDFDDKVINRIISAAVSGHDLNNSSERWQLNNAMSKVDL